MFRVFSEIATRTKKIIITAICLFVLVALFFDFWLHTCPTTGDFFNPHLSCTGTYFEPFQMTSSEFMVWFALTGIPLILLFIGWDRAKDLWVSGFINPKSRYFKFHGKLIFFIEVVICIVLVFTVIPYLLMHFDTISAFITQMVTKWIEWWRAYFGK